MHNTHRLLCASSGAVALLALASVAHSVGDVKVTPLVLENDAVEKVGLVTRIDNIAVNNAGQWLVEADTDNANTDADSVVLNGDGLLLRENQPLDMPDGAVIDSFDSIVLNNNGDSFWNFFIDPFDSSSDSGLYFNTTLVLQEGTLSQSPEFSENTPYIGFFETKVNDNDQGLVVASIDDPKIPSLVDRALVLFDIDPDTGDYVENVLVKETDILPGQKEPLDDIETSPHQFDLNNAGDYAFIADLAGPTTEDTAVYLNDVVLAQEGDPSPIDGVNWGSLGTAAVNINQNGSWVIRGNLDAPSGTDSAIVRDGEVLIREGDSPPEISEDFVITTFGTGPIWIADNDAVLWYGDWDDPNTDIDTGLFYNDTLLVQEGVTVIDGSLVDTLRGITDGYELSDDGRYVIFEAILADGREGAFLIDLGVVDCVEDIEGDDGVVGTGDLLELLANWGGDGPGAEIAEPTDVVDTADLLGLLAAWGPCE